MMNFRDHEILEVFKDSKFTKEGSGLKNMEEIIFSIVPKGGVSIPKKTSWIEDNFDM